MYENMSEIIGYSYMRFSYKKFFGLKFVSFCIKVLPLQTENTSALNNTLLY